MLEPSRKLAKGLTCIIFYLMRIAKLVERVFSYVVGVWGV
jgi:hypothetical protein